MTASHCGGPKAATGSKLPLIADTGTRNSAPTLIPMVVNGIGAERWMYGLDHTLYRARQKAAHTIKASPPPAPAGAEARVERSAAASTPQISPIAQPSAFVVADTVGIKIS